MKFFRDIVQSIYGPEYYRSIPGKSTWHAIRYFMLLILLATLVTVAMLGGPMITGMTGFLQKGAEDILREYPSDLKIAINNGQVTTNAKEPYFFPYSNDLKEKSGEEASFKNLIVIDTKTPFSQEKLDEYSTAAWLTKDTLFINSGTQTRAQSLSDFDDVTIDKQQVKTFIHTVSPWFVYVAPVIVLLLAILIFLFQLFTLVYLCILAFLFRMVGKLFSFDIPFGDVYKMSIHAVTLGIILDVMLQLIRMAYHIPTIPFMFTVVTFISYLINVLLQKELWNKKTPAKSSVRKTVKKSRKK